MPPGIKSTSPLLTPTTGTTTETHNPASTSHVPPPPSPTRQASNQALKGLQGQDETQGSEGEGPRQTPRFSTSTRSASSHPPPVAPKPGASSSRLAPPSSKMQARRLPTQRAPQHLHREAAQTLATSGQHEPSTATLAMQHMMPSIPEDAELGPLTPAEQDLLTRMRDVASGNESTEIGGADMALAMRHMMPRVPPDAVLHGQHGAMSPAERQLVGRMREMARMVDQMEIEPLSEAQLDRLEAGLMDTPVKQPTTEGEKQIHQAVTQFITDVAENNFDNRAARLATSFAHSLLARIPSVAVTTLFRQMAGQGFGKEMEHLPEGVKTMISVLLTAVPLAMIFAGKMRDDKKGIATDRSNYSRLALIAIGGTLGLAALATQSMGKSAPALAQFVLYCLLRDGVQRFASVGPKDKEQPAPSPVRSFGAGAVYAGDQMAAGTGMSELAPHSGAGAADLPPQWANSATRAGLNLGGEVVDDLVSNGIASGDIPRLVAELKKPTIEDVKDTAVGAFPARATLFTSSALLSQILSDTVLAGKSDSLANNWGNAAVGLLLGLVMYMPFAQMGATKKLDEPSTASIEELPDTPEPELPRPPQAHLA